MATKRFLQGPPCYMVKKEDKNSGLTHTLLDGWKGGKVRIPEDKLNDFLVAYAQDVKNKEKVYINEIRKQHFRMFLDLDILHDNVLSSSEIESFMNIAYKCFRRFFPQNANHFTCIVSDAVPKALCVDHRSLESLLNNKEKLDEIVDSSLTDETAVIITDSFKNQVWDFTYDTIFKLPDGRLFRNTHRTNGKLKHGIHAVFPHIIVKTEEALYMREALIDALSLEFADKYATNGWSNVVDNAVYVNSGLRMIYSSKTKNCEVCKNKNHGKDCEALCENGKDTSEGRPYVLRFVCVNGTIDQKITKELQDNTIKLLSYAIIHTNQCKVTDGWKKYEGCPSFGDIIESKTNGPPKLASKERFFGEEKKTTRGWKNKIAVTDPVILNVIQKQIRIRFVKQYANTRVRSVCRDEKQYYISVDGEGSNFCLNLNPPRDHKSNRIWFSINSFGIRVRCFCSCMTTEGRFSGLCKIFQTSARPLNPNDLAILFPNNQYSSNLFSPPNSFLLNLQKEMENFQPAKKQKN